MRVLIVRHGPFPGYLAPETKEWAKNLWRRGVHVEVAVVGGRTPEGRADALEFPVHYLETSGPLGVYGAIRRHLQGADVVHYVLGKRLELIPLLSRRPKYLFNHISVSVTGNRVRDGVINFGKRLQPMLADHVAFTDQALADALGPLVAKPVSLLPVGYPDDLFYPCPRPRPDGPRHLFYHGAVRSLRRLDVLVQALARLPRAYSMTIAGGGPAEDEAYRQHLGDLAVSLGCGERLRLTKLPQSEIRKEIECAYLCLGYVPMLECYQDQFVIKTIEALACHRPVLATATRYTTRFAESLGPDSILLTNGTVDDLVAKILAADPFIQRFYERDNLTSLCGALAPYSFRRIVETVLIPLYQSMLGETTRESM
jgi:glycosyltransferase involved in cell wall biosynthesis